MTSSYPCVDGLDLGSFCRDEITFADGTRRIYDWYIGRIIVDGTEVVVIVRSPDPEEVRAMLPRLRAVAADLTALRRRASDAVVAHCSDTPPDRDELEAAATDLRLETIEVLTDGAVILNFHDRCGEHFPEGYWPAVHVDAAGEITDITIEA